MENGPSSPHPPQNATPVVVTGIEVSITDLIVLILKLFAASIPAAIIIAGLWVFLKLVLDPAL